MVLRVLYRVLGGLGLVAFVVAGYLYFYPPVETVSVVVEEPDRVLSDQPAGGEREVVFVVQNCGRREVRILGSEPT